VHGESNYSPPQFRHKRLLPNGLTPETPNYSPLSPVLASNGELFDGFTRNDHDATSSPSTTSAIYQGAWRTELITIDPAWPVNNSLSTNLLAPACWRALPQ
jgi:hypothetical protein